jgi:hypothetical protein
MVNPGTIGGGWTALRGVVAEARMMSGEGLGGQGCADEPTPRIVPTEEGHRILIEVDFLPQGGWIPRVLIELKDLDARGRACRRLPSNGVCFTTREEALEAGERAGRVYAAELHRQRVHADEVQQGMTGETGGERDEDERPDCGESSRSERTH